MNSTTPMESAITVFPSGKPLGAEIRGADLRAVIGADFAAIQKAWNDHSVLLFRGQQLTADDLIAFSRRFGDLDRAPILWRQLHNKYGSITVPSHRGGAVAALSAAAPHAHVPPAML